MQDRHGALTSNPGLDPALLAFVKCHITSFVKWDVLRVLAEQVGAGAAPSQLARELNVPIDKVRAALADLTSEGIVEHASPLEEPVYRLPADEPTTVVVRRLIEKATRSQELRRIVVAQILRASVG